VWVTLHLPNPKSKNLCDLVHNAASGGRLELFARTQTGNGSTKPYAGKNYDRRVFELCPDCDGRLDLVALPGFVTVNLMDEGPQGSVAALPRVERFVNSVFASA
jgi:hypothetical protein